MSLAHLVYRVVTDPPFAMHVLQASRAVLEGSAGPNANDEEMEALRAVIRDHAHWPHLCTPSEVAFEDLPWQSPQFDPPATSSPNLSST